jgi:hypothetical protein
MDKINKKANPAVIGPAPLLLISFVFYILVFDLASAEGGLMQAAPGQAVGFDLTLDATEAYLEIKGPGPIASWAMQPQDSPNVLQEILIIKANGPWTISVSSDPITAGYMSEYDSAISQFVPGGQQLSQPLTITAEGGNIVDLSQGGVLIQGQGDKVVPITFEQKVAWNDPVLGDGHSYQIALTFSGMAG